MMENNPTLYLIPVPLGETEHSRVLPEYNRTIVRSLHHFIVENIRSARRFLKTADRSIDIDSLTFYELNKHTSAEEVSTYLRPMAAGESMGVISEAGCPAIADPGADVVAIAQRKGLRVEPLVGPSSILMGLMASMVRASLSKVTCPSEKMSVWLLLKKWRRGSISVTRRRSSSKRLIETTNWWTNSFATSDRRPNYALPPISPVPTN